LAVRELEKTNFSVIDRIALYQKYLVDITFLVPLYATLCARDEPLDEVESETLGMKATVLVFQARERLRAKPSDGGKSPLPPDLGTESVVNTIWAMVGVSTPVSAPSEIKSCPATSQSSSLCSVFCALSSIC
jgi:hypothetical protein